MKAGVLMNTWTCNVQTNLALIETSLNQVTFQISIVNGAERAQSCTSCEVMLYFVSSVVWGRNSGN